MKRYRGTQLNQPMAGGFQSERALEVSDTTLFQKQKPGELMAEAAERGPGRFHALLSSASEGDAYCIQPSPVSRLGGEHDVAGGSRFGPSY